jgi:hypothetical protein
VVAMFAIVSLMHQTNYLNASYNFLHDYIITHESVIPTDGRKLKSPEVA